jgi:flagellar protein FlaI
MKSGLMDEVDERLIDYVGELQAAVGEEKEKREEVLTSILEKICDTGSGKTKRSAVKVTPDELDQLRYLMLRDKEGMGAIQPLVSDPYIEDVSCSGIGSVFVEHKIFGGLTSGISFDSDEELDQFVIKLSEKIGRPVTVRNPIVDSTLPDGSRINIVYGSDVSKRGSNFTIRKFQATPFSILDLVNSGTLSFEMASYLSLMLGEGMNTFVSGETASGKTTMLNAISTFIPPASKIVSIEDTPELQVPHPNWTREVVRNTADGSSSVTMFDLLRAALRQRPNEIIIGEIRGEEGAIAFQAMQTGHACMATFHASSVERLIQRMTGHPINVPKTYVDNLNLVIIMSAVRLPDGSTGRRVLSINEVIEYDTETDSFGFIEVFRWDPSTDTFEFPGYMNTNLLEHVVAERRGMPPREHRQIYKILDDRAAILRNLAEKEITNFYELHSVITQANREGIFR